MLNKIKIIKITMAITFVLSILFTGCNSMFRYKKAEPIIAKTVTAADILVEKTMSEIPAIYGWMVVLFVGGLIFWGTTRSKWGWVIPSSACAGMALIISFARYEKWIGLVALITTLAVLIYKAREYQQERNKNRESKIKE